MLSWVPVSFKGQNETKTILILYDMFIFLRKSRVIYFLKNFCYRHRNNKKNIFRTIHLPVLKILLLFQIYEQTQSESNSLETSISL